MSKNHGRVGTWSKWACELGIDRVAIFTRHHDRFCEQAFVHICLIHENAPVVNFQAEFVEYSMVTSVFAKGDLHPCLD